jgi:hypothetical protein
MLVFVALLALAVGLGIVAFTLFGLYGLPVPLVAAALAVYAGRWALRGRAGTEAERQRRRASGRAFLAAAVLFVLSLVTVLAAMVVGYAQAPDESGAWTLVVVAIGLFVASGVAIARAYVRG